MKDNTKLQTTKTVIAVMIFSILGLSLVSCGNKNESYSTGELNSSVSTESKIDGSVANEKAEKNEAVTNNNEFNSNGSTDTSATNSNQIYEMSESDSSSAGNVEVGPNMIKASIERANGEEIVLEGGKLNPSQESSTINSSEESTTEEISSTENILATEVPKEDNYTPSISVIKTFWMDMSKGQDYVFNGEFIVLNFKVKETTPDGAYEININKIDMSNYAAQMIKANTSGGYIYVGNTMEIPVDDINMDSFIIYAPENKNVQQGDSVQFKFNIENNPGIMAFILSIAFDENALDFESIEVGEAAKGIISIG